MLPPRLQAWTDRLSKVGEPWRKESPPWPVATLVNLRPLPQVFVGGQVLQGVQSMGVVTWSPRLDVKRMFGWKHPIFIYRAICSNQQVNGSDISWEIDSEVWFGLIRYIFPRKICSSLSNPEQIPKITRHPSTTWASRSSKAALVPARPGATERCVFFCSAVMVKSQVIILRVTKHQQMSISQLPCSNSPKAGWYLFIPQKMGVRKHISEKYIERNNLQKGPANSMETWCNFTGSVILVWL